MSFVSQWLLLILISFDRPSPNVAFFIAIIVNVPAIQVLTMILAAFNLCVELPLPVMKTKSLYRSLFSRVFLLIFQASLSILFYQVRSLAKVPLYSTYFRSDRELMQRFGH